MEPDRRKRQRRRHQPEGPFFQRQPPAAAPETVPIDPPQRPHVQQQQSRRHHDHDLLDQAAGYHAGPSQPDAARPSAAPGFPVGSDAQQEKEPAQHVLAFRDPRHAFDPRRMQRPQRRHGQCRARAPRPSAHQREDQPRVEGEQENVGQVVTPRPRPEPLDVQHETGPQQRRPVVFRSRRPGRRQGSPGNPILDHGIREGERCVVQGDEVVA